MKVNATRKPKPSGKRLGELLFELLRVMKQQMNAQGYGPSSYLHLETLRYLAEAGEDADMRDIAEYLRVSAPSATGLVDALVREKLVTRRSDPADRRRVRISVSKKGKKAVADAVKHRAAAFARITATLTRADCEELIRILTIITTQD
jgi:DNA-binding MarR family transcriptional regulator